MRIRRCASLPLLLLYACATPEPAGVIVQPDSGNIIETAGADPGDRDLRLSRSRYLFHSLARADSIVLVELTSVKLEKNVGDGFDTTARFKAKEVIRGQATKEMSWNIRLHSSVVNEMAWCPSSGLCEGSAPLSSFIGREFLIAPALEFYREQARARNGKPVAGYSSVGFGFYLLKGEVLYSHTNTTAEASLSDIRSHFLEGQYK